MMDGTRVQFGRLLPLVGLASLAGLVILHAEPSAADVKTPGPTPSIDFNRQIRPILSDTCFACHGPDDKQRKAKLRFDTKEGAFAELRGGAFAIVPGKLDQSALVAHITSTDPEKVMPPAKSGKKLTPEQIALLKQWVEQGAKWSEHWAFTPPKRPAIPRVKNTTFAKNPIDYFVLAKLQAAGLEPAEEAERAKLIRRVTLDLTGLPPTPREVDEALNDKSEDWYERLVDRLLQSPRYGEHMARYWLDAARYGDTHGLHLDNYREIWPYRAWVIKAFNDNKPFDQFLVEQLAGDLLSDPTQDQLIATGYNRCHVSTSEGGSIDEEVYVRNVDDQIDTNGTVLLGLTTGCARCHDHKYDPIRQKDYYSLFAIFNNIAGNPLDGNAKDWGPVIRVPSVEQAAGLRRIEDKLGSLRKSIAEETAKVNYDGAADATQNEVVQRADYVWIDDALPAGAQAQIGGGVNIPWNFVTKPDHPVLSGDKALLLSTPDLKQFVFEKAQPGLRIGEGDLFFAFVFIDPLDPPKEIMLQWYADGQFRHRAYWGDNVIAFGKDNSPERHHVGPLPITGKWVRIEVEAAKVGLTPGMLVSGWAFTQQGGAVYWDKAGIETWTPQEGQGSETFSGWVRTQKASKLAGLPPPVQDIIKTERSKRSAAQKQSLKAYFIETAYAKTRPHIKALYVQMAAAEKEREQLEKQMPTTLVVKERSDQRPAYLLKRGEYDQRGDPVDRNTPAFLPPLPPDASKNRLGFAQWLVAPNHPLTARVAVNRFWQQCFGAGLVKTTEDFGSQGEPPSHPELLDWLAVQFQADGWNVKQMMKRLVMSATYRQSVKITPEKLAKDPANRLLSRGPRYRLDAEVIRDQALFASGMLVERIGGPSVKPPQPAGLWEAVGYVTSNTRNFTPDAGIEKVHRRSLYTFWKRTAPPPQMSAFDAPSRESCTVRRERTDTPLQALLTMNETQYVECSRALAERTLREAASQPEARLTYLFRLVVARTPDKQELSELRAAYMDYLTTYSRDVEAAKKLIAVGESKADASLNPSELAAWTMLGNLVLNLDEVLNKG
jgi:hypothetical protein